MIITRTPFRISFAGGGSDLSTFYEQQEGLVVSAAINKYMYMVAHPFAHKDKIQLKYSKTECVSAIQDIEHPIFREVLKLLEIPNGIEIASFADIPAGTGLGSSSSFTVGLVHCLSSFKNRLISKEQLAAMACDIEIEKLAEPIGKQDQYAAAFGGLNAIRFKVDGSVSVEPALLSKEKRNELLSCLLMFSTGRSRSARSILTEQKQNLETAPSKVACLKEMVALAENLFASLNAHKLDDFGKILHEGWKLKKSLATNVSDDHINGLYDRAIKEGGAIGGKLLGAGGGGYLLFYCLPSEQEKLRRALHDLEELAFDFDLNGSAIIHYEGSA